MTDLAAWLTAQPDITSLRLAACDLNGIARGKRLPATHASKIANGGARMPLSALNCDIEGADIDGSPLVFESGDADGVLQMTERGPLPAPWLAGASLIPVSLYNDDATPFAGDPRHALAAVQTRYRAHQWTPVVATEMEFYLFDASAKRPAPPPDPQTGKPTIGTTILSLEELDRFEPFFNDLYTGCEAMGIPADAATSEAGNGQFEINLMHVDDMMRAADDAWLFKLLVRGVARKHGLGATFAAKPFAGESGSGLHVHFSILDRDHHNIFDNSAMTGTDHLRAAVAGCLAAMPASQLILAPHANSYDRLVPGSHAPMQICWGYENRTAAIRIPGGAPQAKRIEHRVAGGDVNPYLLLTAILGAALDGIEAKASPPAPITGNAYAQGLPELSGDWQTAIDAFKTCPLFAPQLKDNLIRTKQQELANIAPLDAAAQKELYLHYI
ncbi:MAG: glutamine synthetase family protein [Pseudomonadota bacterium]